MSNQPDYLKIATSPDFDFNKCLDSYDETALICLREVIVYLLMQIPYNTQDSDLKAKLLLYTQQCNSINQKLKAIRAESKLSNY
jgi:hypothetical protein